MRKTFHPIYKNNTLPARRDSRTRTYDISLRSQYPPYAEGFPGLLECDKGKKKSPPYAEGLPYIISLYNFFKIIPSLLGGITAHNVKLVKFTQNTLPSRRDYRTWEPRPENPFPAWKDYRSCPFFAFAISKSPPCVER